MTGATNPRFLALLEEMVEREASDLHLTAGERPKLRIDGRLTNCFATDVLQPDDPAVLGQSVLTEAQRASFTRDSELDFSFAVAGLSRFRANLFRQRGKVACAIRRVPVEIRNLRQLGLPAVVARLTERPRGLVLVTGPTGSGKSTTLAAMVDRINSARAGHIVTLEDPIEFVHPHKKCIVNQREIGHDTRSFASGLRHALRQDPDVLLVGEMRDAETIQAALTIAETGHLALATLHTRSAAESLHRIIDVFPSHRQDQVRAQFAQVVEGVITQTLLRRSRGGGRVPACEILIATPAVRALIREGKIHQLQSVMQAGRGVGMRTLNDSLQQLYAGRRVDFEDCVRVSPDPAEFRRMTGRASPNGVPRRGEGS